MRRLKNYGLGLMVAGALIGFKFYNKSETHDSMKAGLIKSCAKDAACVAAVKKHFDTCFEQTYDLGGKHRAAGIKPEAFLGCFNAQAGVEHFTIGEPSRGDKSAAAH